MKQYTAPSVINCFARKIIYGKYANWPKSIYFNLFIKNKTYKKVRDKAIAGNRLRVVFFVLNISMWKYESLFKLLLSDSRFDPIIIPYPLFWHSDEQNKAFEKDIIEYCEKCKFPYIKAFNIDSKEYIPADELCADLVCYTQPYNNCPDFYKVEKFYRDALVFTFPYGEPVDNQAGFINLLSQNVSWKFFSPIKSTFDLVKNNPITKGKNFVYVGSPAFELLNNNSNKCDVWKDSDKKFKRVIWAPHHTIGNHDDLPFSAFLNICDEMLLIADEYKDQIQFVFKPHPILYHRLVNLWGQEKTDKYYDRWKNGINTNIALGDYVDLFNTSDGMIHDSVGFTSEYLFTRKPVMHTAKPGFENYLSKYGLDCIKMHYHYHEKKDLFNFIDIVILKGEDPLRSLRDDFYFKELTPPNSQLASGNMYDAFTSLFS